jgi:hypothetical protein
MDTVPLGGASNLYHTSCAPALKTPHPGAGTPELWHAPELKPKSGALLTVITAGQDALKAVMAVAVQGLLLVVDGAVPVGLEATKLNV